MITAAVAHQLANPTTEDIFAETIEKLDRDISVAAKDYHWNKIDTSVDNSIAEKIYRYLRDHGYHVYINYSNDPYGDQTSLSIYW